MSYKITLRKSLQLVLLTCYFLAICACTDNSANKQTNTPENELNNIRQLVPLNEQTEHHSSQPEITAIINKYFSKLLSNAETLHQHTIEFAKAPSQEKLNQTVATLNASHDLFVSISILRTCCLSPSKELSPEENQIPLFSRLDQYPILPGYLDSVEGYPYSGLIHADIPITKATMEQEFQLGDTNYVTLGFHALEAMLTRDNSPRSTSDFKKLTRTDDPNIAPPELRRTLYVILLSTEIQNDLSKLLTLWQANLQNQLNQGIDIRSKVETALKDTQAEIQTISETNQGKDRHINSLILRERAAFLSELLSGFKDA